MTPRTLPSGEAPLRAPIVIVMNPWKLCKKVLWWRVLLAALVAVLVAVLGAGLQSRVAGVRVMDATAQRSNMIVYMNRTGQTVNPFTGGTISLSDPLVHIPW